MTELQRNAIENLKALDAVTVNADLIALALGMNPGVLRKHVKDGEYMISKVDVCGNRIRFFRKDFLQKIGEMPAEPEDPEEKTDSDRLDELIEVMKNQNRLLEEQAQLLRQLTAGHAVPGVKTLEVR